MINIQPISKTINQVAIRFSDFTLGNKPDNVFIDLLVNNKVFDTIEQPLPQDIWDSWGEDDSALISWVLGQNNITLAS